LAVGYDQADPAPAKSRGQDLVTQLRVTGRAADGNRYVLRVSIDLDSEALAGGDAAAGRVRDGGTATTRIREDDAGQVAESMGHRNGDPADRNV
jgi:hypothetical protein